MKPDQRKEAGIGCSGFIYPLRICMLNLVPLAGEQVSDLEIKPLNLKNLKNLSSGESYLAMKVIL